MSQFPLAKTLTSLKREEGWRAFVYKCSANRSTLGWGRNIDPDGGIGITKSEGTTLLRNDVERSIEECRKSFGFFDQLSPGRQSMLVQACFQLGITSLRKFHKALYALEAGQYEEAASEFTDSKWAKDTPARCARMCKLVVDG
jgi:lysozyme